MKVMGRWVLVVVMSSLCWQTDPGQVRDRMKPFVGIQVPGLWGSGSSGGGGFQVRPMVGRPCSHQLLACSNVLHIQMHGVGRCLLPEARITWSGFHGSILSSPHNWVAGSRWLKQPKLFWNPVFESWDSRVVSSGVMQWAFLRIKAFNVWTGNDANSLPEQQRSEFAEPADQGISSGWWTKATPFS